MTEDGAEAWEIEIAPTAPGSSASGLDLCARRMPRDDDYDARSDFLARMSHEIRSPLGIIVGMTELAMQAADVRRDHYLERIRHNSDVLLHLICDILDFSKIEAGQMELSRVSYDPARVLQDVLEAVLPKAKAKDVNLRLHLHPAVPQAVMGDPTRVRQVAVNLADNSVRYTDYGSVDIRLEVHGKQPLERLCLTVQDAGVGIPEEAQAHVFGTFYRAQNLGAHRGASGTGLGLAITKSLVEQMGGRIELESAANEGSLFRVWLPCKRAPSADLDGRTLAFIGPTVVEEVDASAELGDAGAELITAVNATRGLSLLAQRGEDIDVLVLQDTLGEGEVERLVQVIRWTEHLGAMPIVLVGPGSSGWVLDVTHHQKAFPVAGDLSVFLVDDEAALDASVQRSLHILVVDDSPDNRALLTHMLAYSGHRVTVAVNGAQGVERFQEESFDLVLLDLHMPEMDGFETIRALRELEEQRGSRTTPVVALTAHATASVRRRCIEEGMTDFATKPITRERLFKVIGMWVRTRPRVLLHGWDMTSARELARTCESAGAEAVRMNPGSLDVSTLLELSPDLIVAPGSPETLLPLSVVANEYGLELVGIGNRRDAVSLSHLTWVPMDEHLQDRLFSLLHTHFGTGEEATVPPEMVDSYVVNRISDVRTLSDAVRTRKPHVIRTIGHRIKGTAASFGFPELQEVGEALEIAGMTRDLRRSERLAARLQEWVSRESESRGRTAVAGRSS